MTLLTVLRSQVPGAATLVRGGGAQAAYTVTVNYDQTSGAVSSLAWTNSGGALSVTIQSGGQQPFVQANAAGTGSAQVPAGHFFDQSFNADTKWTAG